MKLRTRSHHWPRRGPCRRYPDGGGKLANADRYDADSASTDAVITFGLGLVRAGVMLLGGLQLLGGTQRMNAMAAFAIVATTSVAVFARAAWRVRRRSTLPPLDATAGLAETLAGVTGLVLLHGATSADPLSWMLPYTVVTTVLLSATCTRVMGGVGTLGLALGYLIAIAPALDLDSASGRASAAPVLADALSYPLFYALGTVIFQLYRSVTGQVPQLRLQAAQNSAERARLQAARKAYQLGHDYPKAYLRELRRAAMPADQLRLWARQFRDDLLDALAADPRIKVNLAEELTNLAAVFVGVMSISLDTKALTDELQGVPILVIAEAARECLNNASYHAYGSAVTLTANSADSALTVTVHDDGPGCNPEQVMAAWALKQNAISLVEATGGGYTVESRLGRGTTVHLTYPLRS